MEAPYHPSEGPPRQAPLCAPRKKVAIALIPEWNSQILPKASDQEVLNLRRFLCVQRHKHDSAPGLWGPPSGCVEKGETPYSAVRREVREETGISVLPVLLLESIERPELLLEYWLCLPEPNTTDHASSASSMDGSSCEPHKFTPTLAPAELEAWAWLTPQELASLPCFPEAPLVMERWADRFHGLSLRPLSADELPSRDIATFTAWGERLTESQWLMRETSLRSHPYPRTNMMSWGLWKDQQILSSCETFKMKSTLHLHKGPAPEHGHSYGIASVFTEDAFKGRSFAPLLVGLVCTHLSKTDPTCQGFHLYSEVSPKIYARSGFAEFPSDEMRIANQSQYPEDVRPWTSCELAELDLPTLCHHPLTGEDQITIWPDYNQLHWHGYRSEVYAKFLGLPDKTAGLYGFEWIPQQATRIQERQWALFCADIKNSCLRSLWFHAPSEKASRSLLQAGQFLAAQLNLNDLRVWTSDRPPATDWEWPFPTIPRTDAIAMFRSRNPEWPLSWAPISRALWV